MTNEVERVVIRQCPVCDIGIDVQKEAHVFRRTRNGTEYCLHSDCVISAAYTTVGLDEIVKACGLT